jgi:hypothetical protein
MPDDVNIMSNAPAIEVANLLKNYSKRNRHLVVFSLLSFWLAVRLLQGAIHSERHRFSFISLY